MPVERLEQSSLATVGEAALEAKEDADSGFFFGSSDDGRAILVKREPAISLKRISGQCMGTIATTQTQGGGEEARERKKFPQYAAPPRLT